MEDVRLLDELCAHAWRSLEWEEADGWVLRAARGFSLRANSVWPRAALGNARLDARIERAEGFYRARGLPARFQLSPASEPVGLEHALRQRGYEVHTTTDVMIRPDCAGGRAPHAEVALEELASADWQRVMLDSAADADDAGGRLAIVEGICLPRRHALARVDGAAAAIGLGVLDRGWLGIYAMRTLAPYRRRGLARAVVGSLLQWAAAQGGSSAYLQVETDNPGAIALYRGLGFARAYGYRYCSRA